MKSDRKVPFFSAIIPTYNRALLLKEALESVFNQNFTDYEVIVIDDGSTDETLVMLEGYGNKIQVLTQKNAGPGAARNLGASVAKGEYLAFLDSDDFWLPWALEVASMAIHERCSPSMLVLKHQDFNNYEELKILFREEIKTRSHLDFLDASKKEGYTILSCSCVILKNECFRSSNGFSNEKINAEDLDLWMKLGVHMGFVEILSPVCIGYRRHHDSAVANLERTYRGIDHMIKSEKASLYPGGAHRSGERQRLISRYTRPASIALAKTGEISRSMDLYFKTLNWNLNELRIKYILGFLLVVFNSFFLSKLHELKK